MSKKFGTEATTRENKGDFSQYLRFVASRVLGEIRPNNGFHENIIDKAEIRMGFSLPTYLRQYLLLLGRQNVARRGFNYFRDPRHLEIVNQGLRFCDENQGIVFWGVLVKDLKATDPAVMQGNPGDGQWYVECRHLSTFLLGMLCWQAVNGGSRCVASTVAARRDIARLRRILYPVEWHKADRDYELQAFLAEGLVVCAVEEGPMRLVRVGAKSRRLVDKFAEATGLSFD